jgi:Na+/proline symporter
VKDSKAARLSIPYPPASSVSFTSWLSSLVSALAVGGDAFFGFICAAAFATMLAVVAGQTLSGVATVCHDVRTNVVRNGVASEVEQLRVARVATVAISTLAIILGIAFDGQNDAFMAGLTFSIACAANFPSLVLAITWRHFTTPGGASVLVGTLGSLVLIYLSPTIQVDILVNQLAHLEGQWWFVSLRNPAIISMPLSIAGAIILSLVRGKKNADVGFVEMQRRIRLGPLTQPKPCNGRDAGFVGYVPRAACLRCRPAISRSAQLSCTVLPLRSNICIAQKSVHSSQPHGTTPSRPAAAKPSLQPLRLRADD